MLHFYVYMFRFLLWEGNIKLITISIYIKYIQTIVISAVFISIYYYVENF